MLIYTVLRSIVFKVLSIDFSILKLDATRCSDIPDLPSGSYLHVDTVHIQWVFPLQTRCKYLNSVTVMLISMVIILISI